MDTLILEFDPDVRANLAAGCARRGGRVVDLADPQQAWLQLDQGGFPLVILGDPSRSCGETPSSTVDLARDFCRRVRARLDDVPRVILLATHHHEPDHLRQSLATGFDDYLLLPLSAEQLELRLTVAERLALTFGSGTQAAKDLHGWVERFELAARGTKDGLWDLVVDPIEPWHSPRTRVWYSDRFKELIGFSPEEYPNHLSSWAERLHPDDRDPTYEALRQHFEERVPYDVEYRLKTKSGEYRWFSARGRGIWNAEGRPLRMAGSIRDVNEQKENEAALRSEQKVLRQLLDVNERDRRLVAYEIHDGLVQYVTGALMHLEVYALKQPSIDPRGRREFDLAMRLLRDSVDEARRLISGLRPPILDESGIVSAIEYLVHDRRGAAEPRIDFIHSVQFDRVAPALESAVFRIVQEALTNVRRHSKSNRARVELTQRDGALHIEVQDWGVGFDPSRIRESQYGLRGISERVRLLEGTTSLESSPGKGTRLRVQLPLPSEAILTLDEALGDSQGAVSKALGDSQGATLKVLGGGQGTIAKVIESSSPGSSQVDI